jgi:hypothetical protein
VGGLQTTKGFLHLMSGLKKVFAMSEQLNNNLERKPQDELSNDKMSVADDLIMEKILENMNSTPLGQVLKKIACLPEVRRQKILTVRRQLTDGQYDINARLDIALDKVIEQLIK